MKIVCNVSTSKNVRNKTVTSRKAKAIVRLKKTKEKYELVVSKSGNIQGQKFLISVEQPPTIVRNSINEGKLTVVFASKPPTTIFICNAETPILETLCATIQDICDGKEVDIVNEKVTSSDFRAELKVLEVNKKEEYPSNSKGFPSSLVSLTIQPINLTEIDTRWFGLQNLTTLCITSNQIGLKTPRKFLLFSRLKKLVHLEMVNCAINRIPNDIYDEFFSTLPTSLVHLNVHGNNLRRFPKIFHLKNLQQLNISMNNLTNLPSQLCTIPIKYLQMSNNQVAWIPSNFMATGSLVLLLVFGNPLIRGRNDNFLAVKTVSSHDGYAYNLPGERIPRLMTLAAFAIQREARLSAWALKYAPRDVIDDVFTNLDICHFCQCASLMVMERLFMCMPRQFAGQNDAPNQKIATRELCCPDCYNQYFALE